MLISNQNQTKFTDELDRKSLSMLSRYELPLLYYSEPRRSRVDVSQATISGGIAPLLTELICGSERNSQSQV